MLEGAITMSKAVKQNEPIVTHMFTADPSAHVFNDKIYIYPSHDLDHDGEDNDNGDQYKMEDYHVFSMDDIDAPVIDHGEALHIRDVKWASKQMWAPDAAYRNGKYYLIFPARDHEGIFRIGVAVGDKPEGPFVPEDNYIEGSYSIDPALFTDEDNKAYMYIGGLWGGQLEKWQTGQFDPNTPDPDPEGPALGPIVAEMNDDLKSFKEEPRMITIVDENGEPLKAKDNERRFFEAPWVHKYNGKYYLSYSTGDTHYLCYAVSESPYGPFQYKGRILEPVIGWTTHQSIVEFKDKWYLFYHDASLSEGVNHKRSVKFRELKYNPDGTIVTMHPYDND